MHLCARQRGHTANVGGESHVTLAWKRSNASFMHHRWCKPRKHRTHFDRRAHAVVFDDILSSLTLPATDIVVGCVRLPSLLRFVGRRGLCVLASGLCQVIRHVAFDALDSSQQPLACHGQNGRQTQMCHTDRQTAWGQTDRPVRARQAKQHSSRCMLVGQKHALSLHAAVDYSIAATYVTLPRSDWVGGRSNGETMPAPPATQAQPHIISLANINA